MILYSPKRKDRGKQEREREEAFKDAVERRKAMLPNREPHVEVVVSRRASNFSRVLFLYASYAFCALRMANQVDHNQWSLSVIRYGVVYARRLSI